MELFELNHYFGPFYLRHLQQHRLRIVSYISEIFNNKKKSNNSKFIRYLSTYEQPSQATVENKVRDAVFDEETIFQLNILKTRQSVNLNRSKQGSMVADNLLKKYSVVVCKYSTIWMSTD